MEKLEDQVLGKPIKEKEHECSISTCLVVSRIERISQDSKLITISYEYRCAVCDKQIKL